MDTGYGKGGLRGSADLSLVFMEEIKDS